MSSRIISIIDNTALRPPVHGSSKVSSGFVCPSKGWVQIKIDIHSHQHLNISAGAFSGNYSASANVAVRYNDIFPVNTGDTINISNSNVTGYELWFAAG